MITCDDLKPIFEAALKRFLQEDRQHILSGIAEQNLCGRLGMSLEREREAWNLKGYFVDTEYNRNGGQLKTILDDHLQVVTIRCDIILHSRGSIPAQDNLLVVEMKRLHHPAIEKEKDRTRLRAMTKASYDGNWSADGVTLPEHVCGYVSGYYLELNVPEETFLIERYAGGALVEVEHVGF